MENESPFGLGDEGRSSRRGRFIDKLFGKDKDKRTAAESDHAANLDAFLHTSVDNLAITHPPPPPPVTSNMPKLAKLDTSMTRFPQAVAMNQAAQFNRPVAPSRPETTSSRRIPRPNKKGTSVRFVDSYPEIIGEGGDETEMPTIEISKRKKPKPQPVPQQRKPEPPAARIPHHFLPEGYAQAPPATVDDFVPAPMKRTQTGYSSIYEPESDLAAPPVPSPPLTQGQFTQQQPQQPPVPRQDTLTPGMSAASRFLGNTGRHDENRRSFIEVQGANMRDAEGAAFAKAHRTASATSAVPEHSWQDHDQPVSDGANGSPESLARNKSVSPDVHGAPGDIEYSPAGSIYSSDHSLRHTPSNNSQSRPVAQQDNIDSRTGPAIASTTVPLSTANASAKLQNLVSPSVDDALELFATRTRHLFELFRLHAETVQPLATCTPKQCARAALWWFLKGRMGLEYTIRERPTSPQAQRQNELDRQQAYTNLAKGYWLLEEATPEISDNQGLPADEEVVEVEQGLIAALNKLSMSMKRNGLLPSEEPFLPQTIDKSIWIDYPPMSQDMMALLSGNWGSGMTVMNHSMSTLRLLDAFPLSDSSENFSYGRVWADVFLTEQDDGKQRYHFPSLLSMVRPQNKTSLVFVIASQNGTIQLSVQENRNAGPVWDDIRWKSDACCIDIKLPRGFMLVVQLTQGDYRMLYGMYEFGAKVRSTLIPRPDENMVFRNNLKSFQYIDSDPNSRSFPKEPVPNCEVALFEKIHKENGPAGPRSFHRGFRIAVVTGPRTRTVSGVHHAYPPTFPVQFGFFRAEGDLPALSLRYESGRQRGRMVLVFSEDKERIRFHCMLTGTNLNHDDKMFADVPLKSYTVSQSLREPAGIAPFHRMPWRAARVVNDEFGNGGLDSPQTVLSDKLRVVLEYANGTFTDRVNVAPGELRVRLEVSNAKVLRVMRQPQQDFTLSVSESQVPKELPRNMADASQLLKNNQTIRSFEFPNLQALHEFQCALTGFEVIFDALAVTFGITRRRMVVPIHKKWEAGFTRIQVVRLEDKQLQLLAFFEDFHHGHCMNFVLKGTDIYETINRSSRAGVKFVDAKFPLPRLPVDKDGDYDDMAFVCLDLPDLPGEHDDISILFENEADRDLLIQCLPAPVKGSKTTLTKLKS